MTAHVCAPAYPSRRLRRAVHPDRRARSVIRSGHEIKHDGHRLMARFNAARVRLFSRRGHDWSELFPRIGEALGSLWSVGELEQAFRIQDATGQAVAYVYFRKDENEARQASVLTHDEARRIAANIAKLPELLSRKGEE